MPPAHPHLAIVEVMAPNIAALMGFFVLFRRARRETCGWPRWLAHRRAGSGLASGWIGRLFRPRIGSDRDSREVRRRRTGTCVAAISALLGALTRPDDHKAS